MTADKRLEQWVESYTKELYSWAFHKVSDTELAKDLVQDTFLAAVEKIQSFKGDSSPKTWLFSILNHKIIDYYRKKINQPTSIENQSLLSFFDEEGSWKTDKRPKYWDEDETELLDSEEFRKILVSCLDELPEKGNASIKLKYLLNKNGDEICQELRLSPTNLWQIMHRAKVQLRECVETNWFKN
jgi:RNA polymerase sigma-70 factor (ECF subfamily)